MPRGTISGKVTGVTGSDLTAAAYTTAGNVAQAVTVGSDNKYPHNSRHTSSFYVLDQLIHYFDNTTLFPNVNQIVLAGHSLGGQMLQRYASISTDVSNTNSPVTYWIGNPNSLTWMSESRPLSTTDCSDYDDYRDGFANYTEYGMTYGNSIVNQGRTTLLANLRSKRVAWARGLLDHGDDSSNCSPFTEGEDRNERFFFFIKQFPVSCSDPTARDCHTVDLVQSSHDNGQMYKSSAGLARLFYDNFDGDGSISTDFGYPRMQTNDDPYPNPDLVGTSGVTNYNTYAGGLTYQGCWANQIPKTALSLANLLFDNSSNTLESCTTGCVNAGYTVAGVQNSTQCYCGNSMNSASAVLVVDNSCRLTCAGNTAEICGGNNRLSVFSNGYPSFSS